VLLVLLLSALGQSCLLFQLLAMFRGCEVVDGDDRLAAAAKNAAMELIDRKVLPLMPLLLRSFDPATVDAATGNNALHKMCTLFSLENVEYWTNKLCQLLIDRGVSVHARNQQGRTLLLQSAASVGPLQGSAGGLRLFLCNGFDLNAQDGDGNGVLHHLAAGNACGVLMDLLDGDGMDGLDHSLRNSDGQTAADLAAIRLAELQHAIETAPDQDVQQLLDTQTRAWEIRQLLLMQERQWERRVRPLLLRCLHSALPVADVADVANLALGYVDGSGPPFVAAADPEAESDDPEEAEPAAAAAAAQS